MAAEPKIAILDYGMGNLRSVEKAFQKVGANAVVTADETEIASADGLVLPGVGAFPRAMERIGELGLDRMLHEAVGAEKPVLGICLGLQLLFQSSIEQGGSEGLGLLEGDVVQVPAGGRKVPHIGWAEVTWERPDELTNGLRPGEPFYFVHSFVVQPTESELLGTASYGSRFACVAGKGKIWGVQFHPEKSSSAGLRMLTNFREICA
ncbi:MAG TPA: imidazole glycerol phosphate synthase subunit HisH [Solirubrobacterales bacterium]|nr:imidazole glycerol phosphate synthase subunit HisH [Solirubrobacterales bacterium]HNA44596.1 imidazole glycerol phosphate synthase subunit HisH [Solirubrobacterales bacterium]HNE78003.1 imidazole glycerol phosphate synthase subunit HisH [Solirubrobacterales bacterium]